ncbi:MAG: phosphoribulokinase, partial [Alphaproteobacteria bacterium]
GEKGEGKFRHYLHSEADIERYECQNLEPGEFTPWQDISADSDILFYEGLHGCVVTDEVNLAKHVDLKIGLVPVINLEWIQKIHRDTGERGYSEDAVVDTILRRMDDYVRYLIPQFALTDINFQTVPVVDTSDPTIARAVPTLDESVVVIRFRDPETMGIDFPYLVGKIHNSWMTRRNSIAIPGGKLGQAIELVLTPIFRRLMDQRG